jgi:acyl-CoA thioester hydrolase
LSDPGRERNEETIVPFTKSIEVRFADCDALQHVNNAVYLHYLEEARLGYYRQVLGEQELADIDFILGEVQIRYLSPAFMGEHLQVTVQMTDMRRSSFTMRYEITGGDGRQVARAETIQVMFDYQKQASKPITADLRTRFGAFEGRDFPAPAV